MAGSAVGTSLEEMESLSELEDIGIERDLFASEA
jgi:hypothetical protein